MARDLPIKVSKASFAQRAFEKHQFSSFADLGGCWGVNAGYALHLLERNQIDRAYVVDGNVTKLSRERGARFPQLSFVSGLLGDPAIINKVGQVDALLMFDILLHQVDPDWDRFIEEWSAKVKAIIVYNQMWAQGDTTVRFVDRGRDWYKQHVHYGDGARVDQWFSRLDEVDPASGRRWRDVYYFWQFGITRPDLIRHVESLGFRLDCFERFGSFKGNPWIQNEGFVFIRRER